MALSITTGTIDLEDLSAMSAISDCTWGREASITIPEVNYSSCTYQQYVSRDCAQRLAITFTRNPEDASGFIGEGMSYEEFISSKYEKHVLSLGMLK